MIEAHCVSKSFASGWGKMIHAVRDVSFSVAAGEVFGLLGPNGAGKTTLLRILATILAPTSGHCQVAGFRTDVDSLPIRRCVGFLSGNTRLYRRMTGREVLRYFGRLHGLDDQRIQRRTQELADLLGMGEFLDRRCESLSTGQAQKVSMARVILHEPQVLILDEPTTGLDLMASTTILEFIRSSAGQGRCVILSTHHLGEVQALCSRIGIMHQGRLLAVGSTQELCRVTSTQDLKEAFLKLAGVEEVHTP